jgi:hypothetical protein
VWWGFADRYDRRAMTPVGKKVVLAEVAERLLGAMREVR